MLQSVHRLGSSPDAFTGDGRPGRGNGEIAGSSPDSRPRPDGSSVKACHTPRSQPAAWRRPLQVAAASARAAMSTPLGLPGQSPETTRAFLVQTGKALGP